MDLKISDIVTAMLGAAKPIFANFWNDVKPYAEKEAKGFAQNLLMIEKLKLTGKITQEEAAIHIRIQKTSYFSVLTAIAGISAITAENALNAAIGAVRDVVNNAIGWQLL